MSYYNNYENRKMPFSQEQMEQARRTSILDVAQNLGLELVRHGSNTMTAKGYGGLVFFTQKLATDTIGTPKTKVVM